MSPVVYVIPSFELVKIKDYHRVLIMLFGGNEAMLNRVKQLLSNRAALFLIILTLFIGGSILFVFHSIMSKI